MRPVIVGAKIVPFGVGEHHACSTPVAGRRGTAIDALTAYLALAAAGVGTIEKMKGSNQMNRDELQNFYAGRREGTSGDEDLAIAAKIRDGELPSPTWVTWPELEVQGYFLFKLRLAGFAAANYTGVQVTRSRLKTGADIDELIKWVIGMVVLTWVADGETWGVARILLEEGPIFELAAGQLKAEPVYGAARVESIALVRDKDRQP
jgi:hypothetical protein